MMMRAPLLSLAVLLVGCGQGADAGRVPRHDGAFDLGRLAQPDGQSGPAAGAPDGGPDRDSTIDRGSSPDQAAEIGASPDLAADMPIGPDLAADTGAAVDLATDAVARGDLAGGDAASGGADDGGCTLADNIPVDRLPVTDFHAYHNQLQIEDYLQAVASALPSMAQYKVLGQSAQGRDLPYLIINATCQASPLAVFTNGTHHGDEPSSTEAVLAIPDYLLRKSTSDASVRSLLETYAFFVLPLVRTRSRPSKPDLSSPCKKASASTRPSRTTVGRKKCFGPGATPAMPQPTPASSLPPDRRPLRRWISSYSSNPTTTTRPRANTSTSPIGEATPWPPPSKCLPPRLPAQLHWPVWSTAPARAWSPGSRQ